MSADCVREILFRGKRVDNGKCVDLICRKEVERMCNACKNLSKVWDASQELMVTRVTNHQNGFPMFLLVQGNKNPQAVKIAVNYCPWCGEKLEHVAVKGGA